MAKKKLNWIATLLISALVGWLGIDRFMMGKIGTGILKLITAGGLFVWWIIDLVLIATKYPYKNVIWVEKW